MSSDDSKHHKEKHLIDKDLIICQLAEILTQYESHYNTLQNKYKKISLSWVIATFLGIGYLISGYESGISISIFLSIMFICFISSMGLFLLWHLDAGIYHKILESIFFEVLRLEKTYPKILGSSHQNIMVLHYIDYEPHSIHGMFYAGFILFLLTISAACLGFYLYNFNIFLFISVFIFIVTGWTIFFILKKKALLTHHSNNESNHKDV